MSANTEPKIVSAYPFSGERGTAVTIAIRGSGLRDTTAAFAKDAPLTMIVEKVETGSPDEVVRLKIQINASAKSGRYPIRLVTPRGISNAIPFSVLDQRVENEPVGSHESPDAAVRVEALPAVFSGRIERRGETDFYAFQATAGQTVTFEVISGLPSTGAAGGNAKGFDPSLSLYDQSGSWFDPQRLNRIAFNDEPLWQIGRPTDAYLVHRFEKAGRYLLRVEAFSGQGGPDYSYELKMLPGEAPQEHPPAPKNWVERDFVRRLSVNRLNELVARGGKAQDLGSIETYRTAAVAPDSSPFFKIPGTLEGELTKPAEAQRARFHLDGPQDIAIEVETPVTAPPLFNPIVRLLDGSGQEVATNVLVGRGLCTGEMTKTLQSKTIVPLRNAGDYTIEIRETTADLAGPGFRYRVQVRPQVAHLGDVRIEEDHINITPGEAKTVRVVFDREEDYRGSVAVMADALPHGIQAVAGADFEPDKDPPRYPGKRERYVPRTERVVVIFTASDDAAVTREPQFVRLLVRPVNSAHPGAVIATKEIPLMVVAKP